MSSTSFAQFNKLFTPDNGLPSSLVNELTMDSDGMLWIATENGLSCFNGTRFVNYRANRADKHSLINNFIRKICAGDDGRMFIGTVDGVQIYDKYTGVFSEVVSTESINVLTYNVNDIVPMKDGTYCVGGNDVYTLEMDKSGIPHVKRNILTGKVNSITDLHEDRHGRIWCATNAMGVWCASGGKVIRITDDNGRNCNFSTICEGNDGEVYGGHTHQGLYVFNRKSHKFSLLPGTEHLLSIRDIKPLPDTSILCIAMDGAGVKYYDTKKHDFINSLRFFDPFVDISSQKVHALYIDEDGNLWMALYQLGVYFTATNSGSFGYFGPRSQRNNIIGDRCVTSIMESYDGSIWVSSDNGGLYGITRDGSALSHFLSDDSRYGLPTTLLGLFQDSRHRTWFGSYRKGSGIVDLATGRCTYIPLAGVSDRLFSIYQYIEDKHGNIWAVTMGNGIVRYDEASHTFRTFSMHDHVQWADCLFYDEYADNLYVGTYDGVVWLHAADKDTVMNKICAGNVVYAISRISRKMLAFCTTSGLLFYDTSKHDVVFTLSQANGLPDDNVLAAQMGNDGRIWISTCSGIFRYDMKAKTMEAFSVMDGLQGNEFYKNASLVSRDGKLWFGGTNGITVFSPRSIGMSKVRIGNIRISGLRADERYIHPGKDGIYVVPRGSSSFTLEFTVRPLYMCRRVIIHYKIDNGSWETLPVGQTAVTLNGLSYGSHHIYMKTESLGGKTKTFEPEIFEEEIYVSYPWYLCWWACLIWIAIIGGFALYVYFSLHRRHMLRAEVRRHQYEETLSEAKLEFFINVVHDLRTPLALIVSPLQKLMVMGDDERHRHLYKVIQKSVDRILRLSNEIMDVRKLNMGKMEIHCRQTDISEFLYAMVNSVEDLADMRQQRLLTYDRTAGNEKVWVDTVLIEKVMLNLLGNAMKYTPDGGTIATEWDIIDGMLNVMVTDNGSGIPDSDKDEVFKSFFRRPTESKYNNGTGLGLSLVKALIELHHGEVHVEDNPEEHGTRMHFIIPVGMMEYTEQERMAPESQTPIPLAVINEPVREGGEYEKAEETMEIYEDVVKPPLHRRNVLIVDDDKDILDYLSEELSGIYNIISCSSGHEAYDTLLRLNNEKNDRKMIDLVISDIMMSGVDGLELCRLVRSNVNLCHIPVILLTAKASEPDRLLGLHASADAYVTKPFSLAMLTSVMSNLLKRADTMRSKYTGVLLPTDSIATPNVKSADDVFLDKLYNIINDNIGNANLSADFIAKKMGMSRVHVYRKLKELTNLSCMNYIRNIRLAKAAEMLSHGKVPVTEVATRVGFKSMSHFSTAFRALYGVSPSEYME